jgi:hypothetical protein
MMLRHSLVIGAALAMTAGTGHAQSGHPSREDLLDQLTRHVQICSEITDTQQRLACYDKMQNNVGGAPAPTAGRQPTPLANNRPPPPRPASPPPPSSPPPSSDGSSYSSAPLSPPPLTTPGGGIATLGPQGQPGDVAPPPGSDADRAFNPHGTESGYGPSDSTMAKPRPPIRRTGPRPVPTYNQPMPLETLTASNLTYGGSHYWQVSISVTSNTTNTIQTQIQCTFRNGSRSVGDAYLGPIALAPGEQISTELIGPPTTTYVDSTNCRVLSP